MFPLQVNISEILQCALPFGLPDPPIWLRVLSLLCRRDATLLIFKAGDLPDLTVLHECLSEMTLLSPNNCAQL